MTVGRQIIIGLVSLIIVGAVTTALVLSAGLGRAGTSIGLPNCAGVPQKSPTEIVLTCADANESVTELRWTGWGERLTAAQGLLGANDCRPDCARGGFHFYPVVLTASGRQSCHGRYSYTTVTVWMQAAQDQPFPAGSPGATDPTVRYFC